jgi:hypothetical protein
MIVVYKSSAHDSMLISVWYLVQWRVPMWSLQEWHDRSQIALRKKVVYLSIHPDEEYTPPGLQQLKYLTKIPQFLEMGAAPGSC